MGGGGGGGGLKALVGLGITAFGASMLATGSPAPVELSAAQRDSVDRGDLVILAEKRETSAWPAVTIYVYSDATPEEAAAVFMDYESHLGFIPSLRKAKLSRVIDKATVEVDYTVAVPVFADEDYTVRNHISRAGTDMYRVDWTIVRASSTKATVGHALFMPYVNQRTKKTGTLLEYYNFVTPGSKFAGLGFIRSRSIRQIGETAKAIAREAEIQRGRIVEMRPRITAMRNAVAP